jgi:hypothetical protein
MRTTRFLTLLVVMSLAMGLLVALASAVTLMGVAALALACTALVRPKWFAAIAMLATLFGATVTQLTGINALGYADEAAVTSCLVVFCFQRKLRGQKLRRLPGTSWFLLYIVVALASSYAHHVNYVWMGQDLFLLLKGPLMAYALAQIDWHVDDLRRAIKVAAVIAVGALGCVLVNLAVPDAWNAILAAQDYSDVRYGIQSVIGPFTHPFAYGQFSSLAVVAIVAYRGTIKRSAASAWLLVALVASNILSVRRKANAGMLAASSLAYLTARRGRGALFTIVIVLLTPAGLLVAGDFASILVRDIYVQYLENPTSAARTLLYVDGWQIALSNFPFGAGLSRFGSFISHEHYSPEYVRLGYPSIYGMGPGERGQFLQDTFWPAILGEAGLFGLLGYGLGLAALAIHGFKGRHLEDPYTRFVSVLVAAWSVEYFIESIAAPVYTTPPLFALLSGAVGISIALRDPSSDADQQESEHVGERHAHG